jgi:hypothetical protein
LTEQYVVTPERDPRPISPHAAYDLAEFSQQVRSAGEAGRRSEALGLIVDFVTDVVARDGATARVFSSPELDGLCQDLGRLSIASSQERDPDQVVFLVTGLYPHGGHTRMLLDLVEADPASRITVLATNTSHRQTLKTLQHALGSCRATVEIAPPGDHARRLTWVQDRLMQLRPVRTYLMQHHYDAPAVAAAQPELCGDLLFSHHGDHALTLGVHLRHARHIDHTAKMLYQCREREGVPDNVLWPITAPEPSVTIDAARLGQGALTTCACGGFEKFEQTHLIEAFPYRLDYVQVVTRVLATTGGKHLHIGRLSPAFLDRIAAALAAAGVPTSAFVQIDYAPSLAEAFRAEGVDLYLCSMPRGGGRATVEAMAFGLPILVHSNYRSVFFSGENEVYPGSLIWRSLDQLENHLRDLSPATLNRHSAAARRHYLEFNSVQALRAAMEATFAGKPVPLPVRPSHYPNALQAFLDERAAYEGAGHSDVRALGFADLYHAPPGLLLRVFLARGFAKGGRSLRRLFRLGGS